MSFIVQPDENGVSDCKCDGDCWLLSYFTADKGYHYHGKPGHKIQITGKLITIECLDSEQDLINRMAELEIVVPVDEE